MVSRYSLSKEALERHRRRRKKRDDDYNRLRHQERQEGAWKLFLKEFLFLRQNIRSKNLKQQSFYFLFFVKIQSIKKEELARKKEDERRDAYQRMVDEADPEKQKRMEYELNKKDLKRNQRKTLKMKQMKIRT